MKQKNYWSYFAVDNYDWIEGKIVSGVLLPHEAK